MPIVYGADTEPNLSTESNGAAEILLLRQEIDRLSKKLAAAEKAFAGISYKSLGAQGAPLAEAVAS